jgi:hypothetical protein
MDQQRSRRRTTISFDDRLLQAAKNLRERAEQTQGAERQALLEKAREFDAQIEVNRSFFADRA